MNNVRQIYNADFYKITAVLLSKKFLVLESEIQSKYATLNLALPKKGFSNYDQYSAWLKKAMEVKESPGEIIENTLKQFNLDPKNEYYRNCLTAHLFFHKQPWEESPYLQPHIELITRKNDNTKELWVKIHPWTKKADYMKLWPSIKGIQRTLPGYRGKEKFQITFERNFTVYQLYLKAKKDLEMNSEKLSIEEKMATHPEYESIAKQFRDGDFSDNLRSITSDFNKLLNGIDIL